jgi:acylphosphatase
MPVKASIHVYGNVQGTGYRALAKNAIRLMNVNAAAVERLKPYKYSGA